MLDVSDDQAKDREESESTLLAAQVIALLAKVTERFESEENEEWRWLTQHSQNPLTVDILRDLSVTAWRVIDAIGRLEPVNGITISGQFRIPKGTVSKVTRRLLAQKLITTETLPNNKKEILFRLTPLGRELFEVHRAFDEQMERGFTQFLTQYSPDELRFLARVLQAATEASFLTLGQRSPTS